ncbi:MAG: DUF3090 family protein [Acidimicrobiales bacterium]
MPNDHTAVDAFTTGTVGPKGERTFYLQALAAGAVVTLKLEKQQVVAMADHLTNLLEDLPAIDAHEWTSAPELVTPIDALWAVGAMGAAYDSSSDSIVIMAQEILTDDEDEDEDDAAVATFHIGRAQALAFVERAYEVVEAGRPPCQLCARPLNHGEGGFCPCWN